MFSYVFILRVQINIWKLSMDQFTSEQRAKIVEIILLEDENGNEIPIT